MLTRKVTSQICLMHFMKTKRNQKKNKYHILQTKLTIDKDNENMYKAEKKLIIISHHTSYLYIKQIYRSKAQILILINQHPSNNIFLGLFIHNKKR